MRTRRNFAVFAIGVAVLLLGPSCSKDSSTDKPAPVPPLAANQGPPQPAADPVRSATKGSSVLPAPSAAAAQALAAAFGGQPSAGAEPEASPGVLDPQQTISGTIVLPATNRAKVARGDVMFLAARRAGGPPGPGSMLAVQKLTAEDFPMRFSISNRDAMIPGIPFEGKMSITVRVDKDGDAMTRRKGDLYGQADSVKVGSQTVVISLDKVQTEDQTLGQPGAAIGEMLPAGHP
jgi:hypothetical protein